jgi:vancomycin resistance protein YoaR
MAKKVIKETATPKGFKTFYAVRKAERPDNKLDELLHEVDPFAFSELHSTGAVMPEGIHGFYLNKEEAIEEANGQLKAVYEKFAKLEEKKGKVSDKLQKRMATLQKQVNQHLKDAKLDPSNADIHQTKAEELLAKIRQIRDKHKMVEGSKKPLPKLEEKK